LEELPLQELLVNVPVFTPAGSLLGIPDLLDPASGLVIESDGAGHRDGDQHSYDNQREEMFEDSGLTVVRFSSVDFRERFAMAQRFRNGHHRALLRSRSAVNWTLTIPAWWYGSELSRAWRYP